MPTQTQIQNVILSAQLRIQQLVETNRLILVGGGNIAETKWRQAEWLKLVMNPLIRHYNLQDYTSSTTQTLYNCLLQKIGVDTTLNNIDPNFQTAGIIIDVIPSGFEPTFITYTQANLVSDGQGGYYLPLVGANGLTVVSVSSNGVGLSGLTPIYTTNPTNLYGFANNSAQSIIVGFI